ncbi:hypothetical protein ACVGVM_08100 [Pseudonocardia bannensis]|uniref:Uncharacterized protein n=1 Tax=Pseudonocardia bannensis TaxID=630973 RepID=A0A848DCU5_9PSEU|nr:hypothetical protein [Pseudonocardia bannensis]NMH90403.1 hypothetical protein [Pseudonocardia bannensis]
MSVSDVDAVTAGFTVVACTADGCRATPAETSRTGEMLREVVRASRHGVLVSTGCLLGATTCRLRPSAPLVLVQPCDADRRPTRPAVRIGPLRTAADVAALERWLRSGRYDPALLPAHLLDVHRRTVRAATN